MDFQDVVRRRRMVRKFTGEPVSEESLGRVLRNASRGPSAGFSQGQAFLVLREADLAEFWEIGGGQYTTDSVRTAPVVIIPFAVKDDYLDRYARPDKGFDRDESLWPVPFWYIDTGMAVLLILQTAVDEGLGAVYFGVGHDTTERLRADFGVPAGHEPIGAIALGHGDEPEISADASPRRVPRRQPADIVHFGRW